jgi:hypothetical protein
VLDSGGLGKEVVESKDGPCTFPCLYNNFDSKATPADEDDTEWRRSDSIT